MFSYLQSFLKKHTQYPHTVAKCVHDFNNIYKYNYVDGNQNNLYLHFNVLFQVLQCVYYLFILLVYFFHTTNYYIKVAITRISRKFGMLIQ